MTSTPTLFDWADQNPSVRADDPATSRRAYAELPVGVRQGEVLRVLRLLGVSATTDEVKACLSQRGIQRERNEVASRLSELADKAETGRWQGQPLVRRVGVRKNHRGRSVMTWALTAHGDLRARGLDQ